MPNLTDLLHDQIDKTEELREEATARVERIWRDELKAAMKLASEEQGEGMADGLIAALQIMVARVAQSMAPVTTDAVRSGAAFARKRAKS